MCVHVNELHMMELAKILSDLTTNPEGNSSVSRTLLTSRVSTISDGPASVCLAGVI